MEQFMSRILIPLLRQAFPMLSDSIKELIVDWFVEFKARCKETDNPWDDLLSEFLSLILDDLFKQDARRINRK